jgi:hypothetical protein
MKFSNMCISFPNITKKAYSKIVGCVPDGEVWGD